MLSQETLAPRRLDFLYSAGVEIKDWVKNARTSAGLTQEQLGNELGVTKGNVSGWENGRHEPSYHQLLKIELLTGVKLSMDQRQPYEMGAGPRVATAGERGPSYGMEPIYAWEHPDDLPPGEFVMIPRLDVHLSAGPGREQVEIELVKENPQAFRTEWIRLMRLKPAKLAAMRASGDSMEPTVHDGDSLLIDTSQTAVVDGKVYALWYDGGERVKRLFRLPGGGLRIKSDNVAFDTIELGADYAGDVRIIGRVVHRSGTGGL
jgi:phage repressor protein C with HTH and peptisase S24 domain